MLSHAHFVQRFGRMGKILLLTEEVPGSSLAPLTASSEKGLRVHSLSATKHRHAIKMGHSQFLPRHFQLMIDKLTYGAT
jgi:hypothetical protein